MKGIIITLVIAAAFIFTIIHFEHQAQVAENAKPKAILAVQDLSTGAIQSVTVDSVKNVYVNGDTVILEESESGKNSYEIATDMHNVDFDDPNLSNATKTETVGYVSATARKFVKGVVRDGGKAKHVQHANL